MQKPGEDEEDCCSKVHDITIDMGYCRHLHVAKEGYRCKIYSSNDFPQLCADYNCVSWAKARDRYSTTNTILIQAQRTLDLILSETPTCHLEEDV